MRKKIIYAFSILISLIIIVISIYKININVKKYDFSNKVLSVEKGDTFYKILDKLKVEKNIFVKLYVNFNKDELKKMEEGAIIFKGNYSLKDIVKSLNDSRENFVVVTIPEGFSLKQIKERLEKQGVITQENFDKALKEIDDFYYYTPNGNFEGYLFPDTYHFVKGESGKSVIKKFLKRFTEKFPPEQYGDKKYFYNRLILASIIEKEAGNKVEMPIVASVFQNRLDKGMKLQSCATVVYLFDFKRDYLYYKDLEIDSPYNTYKYKGLPPTPIVNPGEASIKASLNPAKTNYFYFVLGSNGKHHFSKTYDEHIAVQNKEKRGKADDGKIRVKR